MNVLKTPLIIFLLSMTALAGCNLKSGKKDEANLTSAFLDTVAYEVFEGTLPCADCGGIKTRLFLGQPDSMKGKYEIRQTYSGMRDGGTKVTKGDYKIEPVTYQDEVKARYVLSPDNRRRRIHFLRVNDDSIRHLNRKGLVYQSEANLFIVQVGGSGE